MGRKKGPLSQAMANTNYKWLMYFDKLMSLALSCYRWYGLPDTVDERFIELGLFETGHMVFFRDEILGDLCLQGNLGGTFGFYNEPTLRYVWSTNGYHNKLHKDNSVIIWNNQLRKPTIGVVQMYVDELVDLKDAIRVNINSQKTPFILMADTNTELSLKNMYKRIIGNEPAIATSKMGFNPNDITVLRTDAPYLADKLYLHFQNIYNEYLSYLGVENMGLSVIKSERLTAAEGTANSGNVETSRNSWLIARQTAAEKINKMFGLNISVGFNSQLPSIINSFLNGGGFDEQMDSTASENN